MEIFFRDQLRIVYEIRLIAIREVSPPFGEEHRGLEQDISFNNNNNNNTGYLLHAISPKSKEHIACYKHYNKLQIHCCKTLLRNIVTVTEH